MPDQVGYSCVQPTKGVLAPEPSGPLPAVDQPKEEASKVQARVGKPAPDFEANAFVNGGFKKVKLSDYKGHWVVLCFYPGDFTFV
jgi:hypothetical protein